MTDTSVIQHISNEQHPYRVPLFKLKSTPINFSDTVIKKAQTLRLKSCDFVSNYYNIGYNNNCLRWIRIVENNNTNPYFLSYKSNLIDVHLCKLYITPGIYAGIDEIISEINNKFRESMLNLFGITSVSETIYVNQSLKNNESPLFSELLTLGIIDGKLNNTQLRSEFRTSCEETCYKIVGGSSIQTNDGLKIVNNGLIKIIGSDTSFNVESLKNAEILNPSISNKASTFSCAKSNDDILTLYDASLKINNETYVSNILQRAVITNLTETNNNLKLCLYENDSLTEYNVTKINSASIESYLSNPVTSTIYKTANDSDLTIKIEFLDLEDTPTIVSQSGPHIKYKHDLTIKEFVLYIDSDKQNVHIRATFKKDYFPELQPGGNFMPSLTVYTEGIYSQAFTPTTEITSIKFNLTSYTDSEYGLWHYECDLHPLIKNEKTIPNAFKLLLAYDANGIREVISKNEMSRPRGAIKEKYLKISSNSVVYYKANHAYVSQEEIVDEIQFNDIFIQNSDEDYERFYFEMLNQPLYINQADLSSGILNIEPTDDKNIPKSLFELNTQQTTTKVYRTLTKNSSLYTNDSYYTSIVDSILNETTENPFAIVSRLSDIFSNKVYLKWMFPLIPVTSDTIYSNTSNFIDIVQDPNFQEKYTTQLLPKVSVFDGSNYSLTEDNYKLNYYVTQNNMIDGYYYKFAVDENDLWKKLGYNPCKYIHSKDTIVDFKATDNPDDADIETELNHTYLIKGIYYSEANYHGPITLQHKTKVEETTDYTLKEISLPEGFNIWSLYANQDETNVKIFRKYFYKTTHMADQMLNLSIPKTIEVKITQNKDVEEYLNSNKIVDSIANIGVYEVVRDNQPSINAIQQQMVINQTIDIPPNDELYVFLTNGDHIYSLMDTAATLNIEYIS